MTVGLYAGITSSRHRKVLCNLQLLRYRKWAGPMTHRRRRRRKLSRLISFRFPYFQVIYQQAIFYSFDCIIPTILHIKRKQIALCNSFWIPNWSQSDVGVPRGYSNSPTLSSVNTCAFPDNWWDCNDESEPKLDILIVYTISWVWMLPKWWKTSWQIMGLCCHII